MKMIGVIAYSPDGEVQVNEAGEYLLSEEEAAEEHQGTELCLADVEELGQNHYRFVAQQYYARYGVLTLEITQPLLRAAQTFGGLLGADFRQETHR